MVRKFRHIAFLGDSLSDRRTMDRRKLLGLIPMDYLSGLKSKSPRGRFTNGFLWGDFVAATTVEQLEIQRARRQERLPHSGAGNADLADALLTNDHGFKRRNENAFSLNDDLHVLYEGHRLARFYCEGGLTAHDYSDELTLDLGKEGARQIVSNLGAKRQSLLDDDEKYTITQAEKEDTLIVEWSGANDLITVNEKPTMEEADRAVDARIDNVEKLIAQGYRNFVLFNLPDLSLTPRYARKGGDEQKNARLLSLYFNKQLDKRCQQLKEKYAKLNPPIFLDVFDVCTLLQQAYDDPKKYGFDKDKLTTPFTESEAFKKEQKDPVDTQKHISPSKGYMFWDDVHPTADMHAYLAETFEQQYEDKLRIEPPASQHEGKKREEQRYLDQWELDRPEKALPRNVLLLLKSLNEHAETLMNSSSLLRRSKGEHLHGLYHRILQAKGDLETITDTLSALRKNKDKMKIIETHKNPIYDFFARKHTTHSEDLVKALEKAVDDAIQAHDSRDEEKEGHALH
ncbi:SGNH/GDSL hydrolase family protein [Legionella taurinensis]|uniref:Phospholipase n=1 Tax=Legionella taurinensis TaxID=70611 RepID=A0A3A5L3A5_9GAMM|nr:SGNH/GDSL hydrolase family protein [Legionella taurinensis]RJT46266.1 phospholipase [Legionella taurinensis]RJT67017.1 phospholipase [Legionella taurinensis]STY26504.1 thermolabile hemolysin [Legionella taurinensis]